PEARAQALANFDIPAQPLIDSLKAIASQSNCNVFFEPKLVAGIQAPALRARVSTDEALNQVLQGSGLTYRHVDDKTIAIVPHGSKEVASRATAGNEMSDGALRFAQTNDTGAPDASAAEKSEKDKKSSSNSGSTVEQMVVEDTRIKPFSGANADLPR